jgi:hypothetical protein
MAQPTLRDVHVDEVLTEISIRYKNPLYIADEVFPIVFVAKQTDKIRIYTKSYWFRDEARVRGPGEEVFRSGYELDTSTTYYCQGYAIGKDIPDEIRRNADEGIDLDREATEWVTDRLQMRRERQFVSEFFRTGVWATDVTLSGTSQWSDYAESTPIVDIRQAKEIILEATGIEPNTLVLGYQVYNKLLDHPAFTERIKYTQTGIVTADLIARVVDIDRVLVARNIYETAQEGAPSSMAFNWGKHALILYVPPRPSILEPAAGYTFVWRPLGGAGVQVINTRRDAARYTDVVEGFTWFDQVKLAADLGYFIENAVA